MRVPGKDEPVPSRTHSFDAGSGWMSVALQAHQLGWYTHGMVGLNFAEVAGALKVPLGFTVEAAFAGAQVEHRRAIGKRGDPAGLADYLQKIETPNDRRPLSETAFEGAFPA